MHLTAYHAKYFAHDLTRRASGGLDRLSMSLFDASVDLNPHQIDAALFALESPLSKGVLLADEVGLGKTIEAGIVLCQYWAERKRLLLVLCPASIRKQWALELEEKFNLPTVVLDAKTYREAVKGGRLPLQEKAVVIMSFHYANRLRDELKALAWDMVVIDEAHRLRNAYRHVDQHGPYAARRNMENPGKPGYMDDVLHPVTGKPCEKPYWGWRFPPTTMKRLLAEGRIIFGKTEAKIPELKVYLREVRFPLRSVFALDARKGSNDLDRIFASRDVFKNPKPVELLGHVLPFIPSKGCQALDFFAGSGTTGHAVINLNREDGGHRKFILVEMGDYFDTVLLPRIKKVTFTPEWKDGKPKRMATAEEAERSPRIVKVIRLESYEDALNNLDLRRTKQQQSLLDTPDAQGADGLKEQYVLRYLLDVETRGSQSLLNVAAFIDPTAYKLKVKRPGSDESREVNVDLLETFNYLIGLTVQHIAAPQTFSALFKRDDDPDLLDGAPRRLLLDGRIKQEEGSRWWFRTVTGTIPDGRKTLVIWRKRPGGETAKGIEQDNLVLDEWFTRQGYSSKDSEFDLIYVNGDNNLENLKAPDDTWKVRLIEEDFHRLMFDTEGA